MTNFEFGQKVEIPFYDCTPTAIESEKLVAAAARVINSGAYIGGAEVEKFEQSLADFLGVPYVVSVGNGLDALTLSLLASKVGPGDEVIVPSFTFIATWISVLQVGAIPVAVDIDPTNGLMDLALIKPKVNTKTRAVIPVHLYGGIVDVNYLREIVGPDIVIIEDCAQSIGGSMHGRYCGSEGDLGAFSFYPTKNLGGLGDGGAISTGHEETAAALRSMRSYGFGSDRYHFAGQGRNSRLDAIQAAFLNIKIESILTENMERRAQAAIYDNSISGLSGAKPLRATLGTSSYHHYALQVPNRDIFRREMLRLGISTDMHYPYTIEILKDLYPDRRMEFRDSDLKGARGLANSVVTLPIGSWLSRSRVEQVALALRANL